MGKVSIYLKWSYVGMISLIGVIDILMLGFTLYIYGVSQSRAKMEHDNTDRQLLFGFSTLTLLVAITGGVGVWRRKKLPLIGFAVGGILICLFLLFTNCLVLTHLQTENTVMNHYLNFLPLTNASESELDDLRHKQREFQCCGLESYTDWGDILPWTCLCNEKSTNPCFDLTTSDDENWFLGSLKGPSVMIYSKPCLPFIIAFNAQVEKIVVGILSGFLILLFVSVALCIAILCQMNEKLKTPKVVFSPEAKSGNDSCLTVDPDLIPKTWTYVFAKNCLRILDKIDQ